MQLVAVLPVAAAAGGGAACCSVRRRTLPLPLVVLFFAGPPAAAAAAAVPFAAAAFLAASCAPSHAMLVTLTAPKGTRDTKSSCREDRKEELHPPVGWPEGGGGLAAELAGVGVVLPGTKSRGRPMSKATAWTLAAPGKRAMRAVGSVSSMLDRTDWRVRSRTACGLAVSSREGGTSS